MTRYLLIESRETFDNRDSEQFLDLAGRIAGKGHHVTLFFVQNGVLSLRKGALYHRKIRELIERKVEIHADLFSLKERAMEDSEKIPGVVVSGVDEMLEQLMEPGMKTLWH